MYPRHSFTQQFFAATKVLPDNRIVLAGGLDPITGQRSAFRASVACYDYAAGRVVWLQEQTKSWPYRSVILADGVCAAALPQNFVREPTGLYRFDLATGEPLQPTCEVPGWQIEAVDATAEAFLFGFMRNESSFVRVVRARDGSFQELAFPYSSQSGGKTLKRVFAAGSDAFVAVFSLVEGNQVIHSLEQWSLQSTAPRWETRTSLKHEVRNGSVLLLWENEEPGWLPWKRSPQLQIEVLASESGQTQASLRLPLSEVVTIRPIDADHYAVLTTSGVYIIDFAAKKVSQLQGFGESDFLDFGSLAVDAAARKLVVVTAGNFQRPGTNVLVLDL